MLREQLWAALEHLSSCVALFKDSPELCASPPARRLAEEAKLSETLATPLRRTSPRSRFTPSPVPASAGFGDFVCRTPLPTAVPAASRPPSQLDSPALQPLPMSHLTPVALAPVAEGREPVSETRAALSAAMVDAEAIAEAAEAAPASSPSPTPTPACLPSPPPKQAPALPTPPPSPASAMLPSSPASLLEVRIDFAFEDNAVAVAAQTLELSEAQQLCFHAEPAAPETQPPSPLPQPPAAKQPGLATPFFCGAIAVGILAAASVLVKSHVKRGHQRRPQNLA